MQNQTPEAVSTAPVNKSRAKRIALIVVLWTLAVLVTALIVVGVGIYRFHWSGSVVTAVESIVPYPSAMVNWRIISRSEYASRVEAFQKAVKYNQNYDFNDPKNAEEVNLQKQNILDRMIDMKLESILAGQRNVKVSSAEIDKEIELMTAQSGLKPEDLESMLDKVYGWKKSDFIEHVVTPQIVERKLQEALNADKSFNSDAFNIAEEVKQKIAAGEDFGALAAKYSIDSTTANAGGDLGWVGKGQFVPNFENAAFVLAPGQVSEIIPTSFGLHIIQMVEKNNGDAGEQIHAKHILIATKNFGEWFTEQRTKATVWRF